MRENIGDNLTYKFEKNELVFALHFALLLIQSEHDVSKVVQVSKRRQAGTNGSKLNQPQDAVPKHKS
jgi:hypothetical protein